MGNSTVGFTKIMVTALLFWGATAATGCTGSGNNAAVTEMDTAAALSVGRLQYQVLELVGSDTVFAAEKDYLSTLKDEDITVYQWKNHLVLYGYWQHGKQLNASIAAKFPEDTVRFYEKAFYKFDRSHCTDTTTAQEWDNILLTANLVADTVLQKEYMDYHATQFKEWPEVANGFCNASFQQLLVFRNGRQLMLVISIPSGASLDELNPKTEENNPRVKDWNAQMGKYQEGIAGTKPGATWVFLNPVN